MLVTPLRGKSQFDKIFKEPDLIVNHGYLKIILKKNNLEEIKLGLIVPKKNLSLAARRNYIKRSARELARNQIFLGYDLIFLLINKIKNYSKQEIRNNIYKLQKKQLKRKFDLRGSKPNLDFQKFDKIPQPHKH